MHPLTLEFWVWFDFCRAHAISSSSASSSQFRPLPVTHRGHTFAYCCIRAITPLRPYTHTHTDTLLALALGGGGVGFECFLSRLAAAIQILCQQPVGARRSLLIFWLISFQTEVRCSLCKTEILPHTHTRLHNPSGAINIGATLSGL